MGNRWLYRQVLLGCYGGIDGCIDRFCYGGIDGCIDRFCYGGIDGCIDRFCYGGIDGCIESGSISCYGE